jgi:hypothetical protein
MQKKEILELVAHNQGNGAFKHMQHPKNPGTIYLAERIIKVTIGGVWHDFVQYRDCLTEQMYARPADEFGKFEEVVWPLHLL